MYGDLPWLAECDSWKEQLRDAALADPDTAFRTFRALANTRMDFVRAGSLDMAVQRYLRRNAAPLRLPKVKVAMLGSSTLAHLHAGLRVGALRHGLLLEIHAGDYGMYKQEILEPGSALYAFHPDVVLLSLDAQHVAGPSGASAAQAIGSMQALWDTLQQRLGCAVVQQTLLPVFWPVLGNQEHLLPQSPAAMVRNVNAQLRDAARQRGVLLLAVDEWCARDGLSFWFDPALWFRSKQEIHPRASVVYGEQMGRMLAAWKGLSAKCLVLDLDNTLWGGVIGDDGLDGIVLGQGSTVGEAYVALQRYALQLSERGIILAVCSKNDEGNALSPFEEHADMVLRRNNIAAFVANWQDKATNLRAIAQQLNIGLDSLVFVDDNPAERALIRRELPMVAVPELPDDPAEFLPVVAAAGYFEAVHLTAEDMQRAAQYKANAEREHLRQAATDMDGYLRSLDMTLAWEPFTQQSLQRIVQLNNKTNQFNLTTVRYTQADVQARMHDPDTLTLQLRLTDRYGDSGVIGLLVGRRAYGQVLEIETWLMSCRVLGRNVEQATLNVLAQQARQAGYLSLRGTYRPTAKNSMVRQHFFALGFRSAEEGADGTTHWTLPLDSFTAYDVPIHIQESDLCKTATSIAA